MNALDTYRTCSLLNYYEILHLTNPQKLCSQFSLITHKLCPLCDKMPHKTVEEHFQMLLYILAYARSQKLDSNKRPTLKRHGSQIKCYYGEAERCCMVLGKK